MTAFFWVDTQSEAAIDATEKGFASDKWAFFSDRDSLRKITVTDYDGIYLRAGIRELEQEFACIQRRYSPSWLC